MPTLNVTRPLRFAAPYLAAPLIFRLFTTGFAATPPPPSPYERLVHPRIEVGASFLFKQDFVKQGQKQGATWPRLDAWARNQSGGILMEADIGPKKKMPERYIHTVRYSLPPDGCVVDVFNGTALLSGEQCKQSLSSIGEWPIKTPENLSETCKVVRPGVQQLTVPAGTYGTTEIACSTAPNPAEATYTVTYWYAAEIGAMVKVIRRKVDPTGNELVLLIEELQNYEPAPAPKPASSQTIRPAN